MYWAIYMSLLQTFFFIYGSAFFNFSFSKCNDLTWQTLKMLFLWKSSYLGIFYVLYGEFDGTDTDFVKNRKW